MDNHHNTGGDKFSFKDAFGVVVTYISVAMNPVSSDRNRKRMKTQQRMETVEEEEERMGVKHNPRLTTISQMGFMFLFFTSRCTGASGAPHEPNESGIFQRLEMTDLSSSH